MTVQVPARKNLIFDADDTLWENNIYFIEATEAFLDVMEAARLDREEARQRLTETERRIVSRHGYGTSGFTASLVHTARELIPAMDEAAIEHVRSLGAAITVRDGMELMPGVEESLHQLSTHNRLFVLTKGDDAEQRAKLRRSRLGEYFEDVEVAREKNVQTYNHVLERWRLDPVMTWMIGNSPRSDINPALSAGLNAVLIPHAQTWEMEIEDIEQRHGNRLTVVESVSDLLSLFVPPT